MKKLIFILIIVSCFVTVSCKNETTVTPSTIIESETVKTEAEPYDSIPEPFKAMLKGEIPLLVEGNSEEVYIGEYGYLGPESGYLFSSFALFDIDNDGTSELLMYDNQGLIWIFKNNAKQIYGQFFNFRSICSVYLDGTVDWNYTDYSGLHYGKAKLVFSNGKFSTTELYHVYQNDEIGEILYYIEKQPTDNISLEQYESQFSNKALVFDTIKYK